MSADNLPTVFCAVCKKPVQVMEWFDDWRTGDRVFRVFCHGSRDQMRINPMQLGVDAIRLLRGSSGVAFQHETVSALPAPTESKQ